MLVLSRKVGERIIIGDNIVVTIVRVQGDKVRVGIEAPEAVPVNRGEVAESLRQHGEKHIHNKGLQEFAPVVKDGKRVGTAYVTGEVAKELDEYFQQKGTVVNGSNNPTRTSEGADATEAGSGPSGEKATVPPIKGPV